MPLSIKTLLIQCHYDERRYAECLDLLIVMLNVIILSVVMLIAVAPIFTSKTLADAPLFKGLYETTYYNIMVVLKIVVP
jgi:hypothetical protein